MPFTPVHFGLGALPGGHTSKWFSFRTFCFANVAIDVEALIRIPFGLYPIHDWMHTFLLGTLVPIALLFPIGRPFCLWVSRMWNRLAKDTRYDRIRIPERIDAIPALVGVLLGSLSHVFLDAIMHPDMQPFRPFSDGNPFLDGVSIGVLHAGLFGAGLVGALLYWLRLKRS